MRTIRLLILSTTAFLASTSAVSAKDPHPVYKGVGFGVVRIPSAGYAAPYGYSYAVPAAGYSYGYSFAPPAAGYSYGYSYGAPSYGFGAPSYGYGAAPQGLFLPGNPFQTIDTVLTLIEKIRGGGLGGANSKDVEALRKEIDKKLSDIETRLGRLERDYKDLKAPEDISNRFKKLEEDLNTLGKRVKALEDKK